MPETTDTDTDAPRAPSPTRGTSTKVRALVSPEDSTQAAALEADTTTPALLATVESPIASLGPKPSDPLVVVVLPKEQGAGETPLAESAQDSHPPSAVAEALTDTRHSPIVETAAPTAGPITAPPPSDAHRGPPATQVSDSSSASSAGPPPSRSKQPHGASHYRDADDQSRHQLQYGPQHHGHMVKDMHRPPMHMQQQSYGVPPGMPHPIVGHPYHRNPYAPSVGGPVIGGQVAYGMPSHPHLHGPQVPNAAGGMIPTHGASYPAYENKPSAPACVNCQRSHLACDRKVPCGRCVAKNKESTCAPAVYKKRGWQLGRRRTSLLRERMQPHFGGMFYGGVPFGMEPMMGGPMQMHPGHHMGGPYAPGGFADPMMLPPPPDLGYGQYPDSNAVHALSLDGDFLHASPVFCNMLGYSEAELVGSNVAEILHPSDVPMVMNELHAAPMDEGGRRFRCRLRPNHTDAFLPVEISGRAYMGDPSNDGTYFVGTARPVDQYAMEPYASGQMHRPPMHGGLPPPGMHGRHAVPGIPGIPGSQPGSPRFNAKCGPDGTCVELSPNVRYVLGFGQTEAMGLWGCQMVHGDDLWRVATFHDQMVAAGHGASGAMSCRMRTKAGDFVEIDFQSQTVGEGPGLFVSYDVGLRDVSRPPVHAPPQSAQYGVRGVQADAGQEMGLAVRRTMKARNGGDNNQGSPAYGGVPGGQGPQPRGYPGTQPGDALSYGRSMGLPPQPQQQQRQ